MPLLFKMLLEAYNYLQQQPTIGHLHDDIILLLRPESFRRLLSCANLGFCHWNLTGITKFERERKNEEDSGRSSKMTPSCRWPIQITIQQT